MGGELQALQFQLKKDITPFAHIETQLPKDLLSKIKNFLNLKSFHDWMTLIEHLRQIYSALQTTMFLSETQATAAAYSTRVMEYMAEVSEYPQKNPLTPIIVAHDSLIVHEETLTDLCHDFLSNIQAKLRPLQRREFISLTYGHYKAFQHNLFEKGFQGSGAEAEQKFRIVLTHVMSQLSFDDIRMLYYAMRSPDMIKLTTACDFATVLEEREFDSDLKLGTTVSLNEGFGNANITHTICNAMEQIKQAVTEVYETQLPVISSHQDDTKRNNEYERYVAKHINKWAQIVALPITDINICSKLVISNLLFIDQNKFISQLLVYYVTLNPLIMQNICHSSDVSNIQERIRNEFQKNFKQAIIEQTRTATSQQLQLLYNRIVLIDKLLATIRSFCHFNTRYTPLYKTLCEAFLPLQAAVISCNERKIWEQNGVPLRERSSGSLRVVSCEFSKRTGQEEIEPICKVSGCTPPKEEKNQSRLPPCLLGWLFPSRRLNLELELDKGQTDMPHILTRFKL